MTLDPRFQKSIEDALAEVAPREMGSVTADRALTDLGLDSVALAELLVVVEDKLDVTLEDHDLSTVKTFGDLQALVRRLSSGG